MRNVMTLSMTPFTTSRTKLFLRSDSLQSYLQGSGLLAHFPLLAVLIRDIALGIVRTALHTMDTATGVGIMGTVINTAANLEATKVMAAYKAILT